MTRDGELTSENINIALIEMTKNRLFCYLYYLIKDWIINNWKIIVGISIILSAIASICKIMESIFKR